MTAEKDILVLKCNAFLRPKEMDELYRSIHAQKDTGVIIVPPYIEPILVHEGTEIKISEFVPGSKKVGGQIHFTPNIEVSDGIDVESEIKKVIKNARKIVGDTV